MKVDKQDILDLIIINCKSFYNIQNSLKTCKSEDYRKLSVENDLLIGKIFFLAMNLCGYDFNHKKPFWHIIN